MTYLGTAATPKQGPMTTTAPEPPPCAQPVLLHLFLCAQPCNFPASLCTTCAPVPVILCRTLRFACLQACAAHNLQDPV
jgi:hypothetical protein